MQHLTKQFGSVLAVALFLAAPALAQTPAPSAVGMINFQRAISQNDEGVKAAGIYSAEGKKLADSLLKSQAKVAELQEKLTKGGTAMSDTEKNILMREIKKEKDIYDLEQQSAQSTLDDRQEELFRPIADRVHKIVEVYAKELNLAVVVNATEDMLYASDVVDITTEIIRRVNADIVKNPPKPK
jgi:Skp family chaperone for outer membrane proteins